MNAPRNRWHMQEPVASEGLALTSNVRALRDAYYANARVPSPNGDGFLEVIGVRSNDNGTGTVLFECSVSSLRYELGIPRATTEERQAVREQQGRGVDPTCPRHDDPPRRLQRTGTALICPACGVRYGTPT